MKAHKDFNLHRKPQKAATGRLNATTNAFFVYNGNTGRTIGEPAYLFIGEHPPDVSTSLFSSEQHEHRLDYFWKKLAQLYKQKENGLMANTDFINLQPSNVNNLQRR